MPLLPRPPRRPSGPGRPLRALLCAVLVSTTLVPIALAAPAAADPQIAVTTWASGFDAGAGDVWDIAFLPDGRALISTNGGHLYLRATSGALSRVDIDLTGFSTSSEGGLMGMVIDPGYATNRRFYTCQNQAAPASVEVIAWRMNVAHTAAVRVADPLVGGIPMTTGRHSGCRLRFGFEGYLWISTGDAAIGTGPQDLTSLGGKVLRVDPRTGEGHPGNPFASSGNANTRRIYSYGHRNVQGLTRRPCTDQMWTAEHGPGFDDEINLLRRGGNAGWNPVPGYDESVPMTDLAEFPGAVRARWSSGSTTIALSGIDFLVGAQWADWDGALAGAALKNQSLSVWDFGNPGPVLGRDDRDVPITDTYGRLRAPQLGPDGALYVTGSSMVLRVAPTSTALTGLNDLDGDGYDDLVVGVPGEDVGAIGRAGMFNVLYGGASGIEPANGSEGRSQDDLNGTASAPNNGFGSAVAYGDVNGDGTTDVVVGAGGTDLGTRVDAGGITVVCGSTRGLEARASQSFTQRGSVPGAPEADDRFGAAVALGDFDGDGYDDVAVGAPGEDIGGKADVGTVTVLPGTSEGVITAGSRTWSQAGAVPGANEAGDRFGAALAVGDFDGDGYDDLAIGVPGEDIGTRLDAGLVVYVPGSNAGLVAGAARNLGQRGAMPGVPEAGDRFGAALALGDIDGDGRADLAIGAPGESVGGRDRAGVVAVVPGSPSGPSVADATGLGQKGALPGGPETGDLFGSALRFADTNGDGRDDLAIGVPGEDIGGRRNAGVVTIVPGSALGLRPADAVNQSQAGAVVGTPESGDRFGAAL